MTPEEFDKEASYQEVARLLSAAAKKFWDHHGGYFPDLESCCNEAFADAYADWNPELGYRQGFATWCSYKAWHRMQTEFHTRIKKEAWERQWPAGLDGTVNRFDFYQFLSQLSEDARLMVVLVCEQPCEMKLALAINDKSIHRGTATALRNCLRQLLHEAGWSRDRIEQGFHEIQEALE